MKFNLGDKVIVSDTCLFRFNQTGIIIKVGDKNSHGDDVVDVKFNNGTTSFWIGFLKLLKKKEPLKEEDLIL